jgi:hypothetical protein
MLCSSCLKLASNESLKKCMKCNLDVKKHIAIICESCSNIFKLCEACLKSVASPFEKQAKFFKPCNCGKIKK